MGNKHSLNGRISNDNNNNGDVDAEQQPRSVGDLDTRQKWALFKGTYASLCVFVMSIISVFLYINHFRFYLKLASVRGFVLP